MTTTKKVAEVMADRLGEDAWRLPEVVAALDGWCGDLDRGAEEIADELCDVVCLTLNGLGFTDDGESSAC